MEKFPINVSFNQSIGEINDKVEIFVSRNQSLSSISKIACQKVGINYSDKYQFMTNSKTILSMTNTIEYNNVIRDSHLVLTDSEKETYSYDESTTRIYQTIMWKPLAIIAFFIGTCGLIILITIYVISLSSIYTYSVVIDAGSTSSKTYLYYWQSNTFVYNADVIQLAMCKSESGISSFETNPSQSFTGIKKCLENEIIPKIPKDSIQKTSIYLGATAGMRMLSYNNPNATAAIINFIRSALKNFTLKLNDPINDVSIISGSQEGIFGWTTINYLIKTLPKVITTEQSVIGALDMGGASTQITFVDQSPNDTTNTFNLKLYGNSYSIYSYSYLCYGKSQAENRFLAVLIEQAKFNTTVKNPCMSKNEEAVFNSSDIFNVPCIVGKFALDHYGHEINPPMEWKNGTNITFIGSGNYNNCTNIVNQLFNTTIDCKQKPCTFNGVFQPSIRGKFGAFSAYNLIKTILNKNNERISLKEYTDRLKNLCNSKYNYTIHYDFKEDEWIKWRCFDLFYMITILNKFGFDESNWNTLEFFDKIDNSNVGWALGFMINKTSIIPKEKHFLPIENYLFAILFVVMIVIMAFGIIFSFFYCIKKRHCRDYVQYPAMIEEENLLSPRIHNE